MMLSIMSLVTLPPPPVWEPREECLRCRRPRATCWCAELPRLSPRTRVVFVQHPRERTVPIGTARMAHLALDGSLLVSALCAEDDPRVSALLAGGACAVLYPGPDAIRVEDWQGAPPRTLFVLDGTWSQAKKLFKYNPRIAALPKLALAPEKPGNYRIRKEPSAQHLATIEATAQILGVLEGDRARYEQLLHPFTVMVDRQIAHAAQSAGSRHRRRAPKPHKHAPELIPLLEHPERAVVVYAEGNCISKQQLAAGEHGAPELIHLAAARPCVTAAEALSVVLAPRKPLGDNAEAHLGVPLATIRAGVGAREAVERYRAFLAERDDVGEGALVCMWGRYARDLLVHEGEPHTGFIDLRALTARQLQRSAGGIEPAARALGLDDDLARVAHVPARADRRIALLSAILRALLARARS